MAIASRGPNFVAAHRRLMEPGWFVTGNRVLLSEALTERDLQLGVQPEFWSIGQWALRRLNGDVNRVLPLMTLPLDKLRKRSALRWRGARGSNMAFWRSDLIAVDGFDSGYTGWGREDSDIFIRMIRTASAARTGVSRRRSCICGTRKRIARGLRRTTGKLDEVLASDRIRAQHGLVASHRRDRARPRGICRRRVRRHDRSGGAIGINGRAVDAAR